mgnify:CR=1 FL=1
MNLKVVNPISRDGLFKRGHDENVERMKQKEKEFYARKPKVADSLSESNNVFLQSLKLNANNKNYQKSKNN